MTLSFKTHWAKTMPAHMAGKPTYFPEKVLKSLFQNEMDATLSQFAHSGSVCTIPMSELKKKKHTIREDAKGLWKAGRDIHFVINNRTKNRLQFAPVMKCVSVQRIEIFWNNPWVSDFNSSKCIVLDEEYVTVGIEGRTLGYPEVCQLATNDGFDSVEDFFSWFNKDFKGKIIHWTDINY